MHSTCHYYTEDQKDLPKIYPFTSWPGIMINPQWLKLLMSRTDLHGPKDVQVIEVQLYINTHVRLSMFYNIEEPYSRQNIMEWMVLTWGYCCTPEECISHVIWCSVWFHAKILLWLHSISTPDFIPQGLGPNTGRGGVQLMSVFRFILQNFSLSSLHHLNMTSVMLKTQSHHHHPKTQSHHHHHHHYHFHPGLDLGW